MTLETLKLSKKRKINDHWEFKQSGKELNYSTHSIFRYFGKLPGPMTKMIIEEGLKGVDIENASLTDIMCGSGTTLIEGARLGCKSLIGVDVNPLSILVSTLKTTELREKDVVAPKFEKELMNFESLIPDEDCFRIAKKVGFTKKELINSIPDFPNRQYWVPDNMAHNIALLKLIINSQKTNNKNSLLLKVVFASLMRKYSMADSGPGRVFYKKEKRFGNLFKEYEKRFTDYASILTSSASDFQNSKVILLEEDARDTSIKSDSQDLVFFHPPYFALYRYSSDVMRFELEWTDCNRRKICKKEIKDGFKTSNPDMLNPYIEDLGKVAEESSRILKKSGRLVVINNNSTLSEKQLPVIDLMNKEILSKGFRLVKFIERPVHTSQSKYHKSANPNIATKSDFILFYEKESH